MCAALSAWDGRLRFLSGSAALLLRCWVFFLVPGVALGLSAVTSAEGVIFALIGGLITRIFVYNNWLG